MSAIAFAAYTACCVLALAAQLGFALREWRSLGRREPMFVDQVYVRVERYFGLAFREKLERWLQLTSREVAPGVVVIDKEQEQIWVHKTLTLPAGARVDSIIVADTLETGYGCRLFREVYTRHDCHIGSANVLQALAADGAALVGRGTRVIRWIDAAGELILEPDCRVLGRATSAVRLVLHAGASVNSAHAPVILTVNGTVHEHPVPGVDAPADRIVLSNGDQAWTAIGATGSRRRITADCIAYNGDLTLPTVTIPSSIVVRGSLTVGPHSVLEGDVKATGSIHVGARSICRGNLVAGRDVRLASGVTFRGVIFAEGSIRVGPGVFGVKADPGVAVYAAKAVILHPGVTIVGKVSSGAHVVVSG